MFKNFTQYDTVDNGIKPGRNLTVADKRVAERSKVEYWDIK